VNLSWGAVVKNLNWTFFFNLLNFAILLYLLKRFLYKPALEYLDKRRERIAGRMQAARESEESAARLEAQRAEALEEARAHAREIVEAARTKRDEIIVEAREQAKEQAGRIVEEGRREVALERGEMQAQLREAYAEIAVLGASRILGREVSLDDHRRFLDELLEGIDADALRAES
jgi:F-type H+-transporting ATPase subunit b